MKSRIKISQKWLKMSEIYLLFTPSWVTNVDRSEHAREQAYLFESQGIGELKGGLFNNPDRPINAYSSGKHWMDTHVKMWNQGLREGVLFHWELYESTDPVYPSWWLDKVLHPAYVWGYRNWKQIQLEEEEAKRPPQPPGWQIQHGY